MRIVLEYDVPDGYQDWALQAHDDGDRSWLTEITFHCRQVMARVE